MNLIPFIAGVVCLAVAPAFFHNVENAVENTLPKNRYAPGTDSKQFVFRIKVEVLVADKDQ